MSIAARFEEAQKRVKTLASTPDTDTLLALYALYKQGTVGDVDGKRPGMLDLKGRAKWDAWERKKGLSKDQAMEEYCRLVDRLAASG